MGKIKYLTEEERNEAHRKASKKWRKTHPLECRAHTLVQNYKREDKKYNRGEGDLTAEWVVENIFSKPCVHCGKEGWNIIGCNRLDNAKPHTMDNVEPCCCECNHILACEYQKTALGKKTIQIDPTTNEVINNWNSPNDAAEQLGINHSHIRACCEGGYFDNRRNKWVNISQYKGYIWRYV